jgi:5-methylcytosine-specific restriction endonuclease McrA
MTRIPARLRQRVARRARFRCEYCKAPRRITGQTFHIDHIQPESKGGKATSENLCFCCPRCNQVRGSKITATDPVTQQMVSLFNPRRHQWNTHFEWSSNFTRIVGITPIGRATVRALKLNSRERVEGRKLWLLLNLIP